MRTIFMFGLMIMGKELLAELKLAIFKNLLDARPKMETHERGFWSPFEDLGPQSAIFWYLNLESVLVYQYNT